MQPAEVQASRVKEYVLHGSKRRNRKLRDSPLNSRFPSLYKLYIWKEKTEGEEEERRRWVKVGHKDVLMCVCSTILTSGAGLMLDTMVAYDCR